MDDDPDLGELISRVLVTVGYAVTTAGDATTAVERAAGGAPALVTLDLSLPDGSGADLVRQLRAVTSGAHLLVATGRSLDAAALVELREAGADDVLIKPFALRQLRERAEQLLQTAGASELAS